MCTSSSHCPGTPSTLSARLPCTRTSESKSGRLWTGAMVSSGMQPLHTHTGTGEFERMSIALSQRLLETVSWVALSDLLPPTSAVYTALKAAIGAGPRPSASIFALNGAKSPIGGVPSSASWDMSWFWYLEVNWFSIDEAGPRLRLVLRPWLLVRMPCHAVVKSSGVP
jgi:hypothetical protein